MATYPVYPATTFTQAVELTIFASNQLHDVINGDALTTVETENGGVPTLRKALVDNFYFKTPINWVEGESATVFNQLYYFDGTPATSGWYYAPQATLDSPVAMGSTPSDDDDWRLYQTATQSIPAQVYPWSMEITEEISSVSPPYEFDSAIVTLNGVVLVPNTDYTISNSIITFTYPLEVSEDSDVVTTLFCYLGKVEEGNAETNYITYANLAKEAGASLVGTSDGSTVQEALNTNTEAINMLNQNLASNDADMGAGLIGTKYSDMNLEELIDSSSLYSVLWAIPYDKHQYLNSRSSALSAAGDLISYIEKARDAAQASGKILFFPAGYYPVSRTVTHLPSTEWKGVALNSFLVATSDFNHATPLYQWAAATTQSRYICRGMAFDGNSATGRFVGGVHINCGNAASDFSSNLITNCWYSGFRINPASGSRDVLNLNVSNIYIVNSGSVSYYPGFSIEMSNSNFTDGQITGIDISGTAADPDSTRGPVAFSLIATGKNIFNVLFERFFTSTRRNTHWYQNASNTFLLCNCSFRMFSGETHINTTGTLGNTALVQMDLQNAGAWCSYNSLYANRSLNNGGLYIGNGYAPIFRNMNFLPAWDTSDDADATLGQYLMGLQIASGCRKATFESCAIENQYSTSGAALWRYMWGSYMVDNGEGTRWESAFMTGNPVVQHSLDWYSINSTTAGKANNASYQGADITVSAGSAGQLTLVYPAVPANASDQYIQYELLGSAQYVPGYYYLTAKVKFNSGIPGNHYLRLQMWGTNYTATLNTVGEEQWLCCRFAVVAGNTTVNKLILHVGNTSAAAAGMSVTLSEICLTTDRFAYPPNYRKTLQVL